MSVAVASILVMHPGLQHSHQLAWALSDADLLLRFCSGVPVKDAQGGFPGYVPRRYERKLKHTGIDRAFLEPTPWSPLLYRLLARIEAVIPGAETLSQVADWCFDWWASVRVRQLRPKAVVGYEDASLRTFRAAKKVGAVCILDAASIHHKAASVLNPRPISKIEAVINRRKDLEVQLADHILTCSDLAAQSYLDAGVVPSKVVAEPLGADLANATSAWVAHEEPLHFVFAGALSKRKGIDLILESATQLRLEGLPLRVTFVGGLAEAQWLPRIQQCPVASHLPSLPQKDLFDLLGRCDCLLLPSRYDSFGMVVAEAMACGTPVIVSSLVGAKMMVESQPGSGWVVSPDTQALKTCMRNLILNRATLFSARVAARQAAARYTWEAYRQRVARRIFGWLD